MGVRAGIINLAPAKRGEYDVNENRSHSLSVRPMKLIVVIAAAGSLCAPAAAAASSRADARVTAPRSAIAAGPRAGGRPHSIVTAVPMDTTVRIRFLLPSRPLPDALAEFSRQAGVRVRVERAAAARARSAAVAGSHTAPEALRLLLAGSGLSARFADTETALVTADGSASVYALTPVTAVGARSRGYGAARTLTATKTDTPLRDAPQSVTVITRDAIADQAMQGMADVVRYVPGITMGQGEGHRDAPTIRGSSTTADFFVDGVRDDAQYLRDLYNVERVEALKGANAMIFGRGGGGGVVNRVVKEAEWAPTRTLTVEGGSYDHRRTTVDAGEGLGAGVAARVNGVYERSGGFRDEFALRRWGVNPTLALAAGARTTLRAGYEHFDDRRMVDRGIPSFGGRPSDARITTFFGNPDVNRSRVTVNAATASVEHTSGARTFRSRARFADYAKFYQNTFPGAVNADETQVALSAYNQTIGRRNLFDQTDVTWSARTGGVRHTLLAGAEIGRQHTGVVRETGYFNGAATSFAVPFARPTVATPVTFRPSATDGDNHTNATVAGVYAQDQVALARAVQAIVGLRYDRFRVAFHNRRTGDDLGRTDGLVSPRAGLVLKPVEAVSFYGSWSLSYLPSSGDQFGSLTATTETLRPERFINREAGAKWDVRGNLALTAAVYRLDRTNTSAPDPNDATRTVQTGSQRTTGFEAAASGNVTARWQVMAGFAAQKAIITSTTVAAKAGAIVPLVPRRTLSVWNRWQAFRAVGLGLGVIRQSEMFAAIDNTVTLPAFTRADGAVFLRLSPAAAAQANVENVLNARYYATSQGNNNIMPGAPRTLRISLTIRQ